MASHNDLGKTGEVLAAQYLTNLGYIILSRNWRHSHYEIDIIATKGDKLHFIEVKTRRSTIRGYPEESVSKKKFNHLKNAADEYLFQHPNYKWIQYDILSIIIKANSTIEYFLLADVFL